MPSTPICSRSLCRRSRTAIASCRPSPGLGITIDENKLMAQVGEPQEYRTRFDPDDGSVIDW